MISTRIFRISRYVAKPAILLFISLLLSSCAKPLDGQIFIVTKGRDNVRLGLVEIRLIDDKVEVTESQIESQIEIKA